MQQAAVIAGRNSRRLCLRRQRGQRIAFGPVDPRGAKVDGQVGPGVAAVQPPANPVAPLKDRHAVPGLRERLCRAQPRNACADHDHAFGGRGSASTRGHSGQRPAHQREEMAAVGVHRLGVRAKSLIWLR